MADNKTWQVIITNQIADDQDKNRITDQLATLFKIEPAKAAQLISKPKTIVKDNIDEDTAKKYLAAISRAGAPCEILNTEAQELPDIIEPVKTREAEEGLIRQPATPRSPSGEPPLAMVEKERQQEQQTREKLSAYKNVDSAFFCPDCGTIRSAADALCLHCGYDPSASKADTAGMKRLIYVAAVIVIVLAAAGYLAMPLYQQYAKKASIEEGLKLAFETRNHIEQFIRDSNFWPNQNIDANLPKVITNEVIAGITITGNGEFTVILHEHILGKGNQTMVFKPKMLKGRMVWNCTGGTLANEYRPEICRTVE